MNKQLVIWVGLLLALLIPNYGSMSSGKSAIGTVSFILGDAKDVTILRAGGAAWMPAKLYEPVYSGDQIQTKKESRCETKLTGRGVIRIGENTIFAFSQDLLGKKLNATMVSGRLWANFGRAERGANFWVRTPNAVCSVRGTIYRIDADSSTRVKVYQGRVDIGPAWVAKKDSAADQKPTVFQPPIPVPGPAQVPGPSEVLLDQWIQIVAGQQIEVRANGSYQKSNFDPQQDQEDDWVKWNQQRDHMKK